MTDRPTCADIESLLFDWNRGELSDLKRAEVDQHLASCKSCRKLATRSDEMFRAAAEGGPSLWTDVDADRLFERIEAGIAQTSMPSDDMEADRLDEMFAASKNADADLFASFDSDTLFDQIAERVTETETSPAALPAEEPPVDHAANDDQVRPALRWRLGVVLATAACAAIVAWWALPSEQSQTDQSGVTLVVDSRQTESSDELRTQDSTDEPRDNVATSLADRLTATLPALQAAPSTDDSVRLFASTDAEYGFVKSEQGSEVELQRGTVLVEYVPRSPSQFSIQARDYTVTVVGTVFAAQVDDDDVRVTVFEGAVRLETPDGDTLKVESGEIVTNGERGTVTASYRSEVERYVDLDDHLALLLANEKPQSSPSRDLAAVDNAVSGDDTVSLAPTAPAETPNSEPANDTERRSPKVRQQRADHEPTVPASKQRASDQQPASREQPPSIEQLPAAEQPTSIEKPTARDQPVSAEQLPAADQPTSVEKPTAREQPVSTEKVSKKPVVPEPGADSPDELRGTALSALHSGDHRQAVELLARALKQTPASDPASADILLELARIHLHQLDEPRESARYLRQFVHQWPDDPAAAAVRSQLCDIDSSERPKGLTCD